MSWLNKEAIETTRTVQQWKFTSQYGFIFQQTKY